MPFVRYARDRRGYETLYVMHAFEGTGGSTGSGGSSRTARVRVLYACRTVPYAKVGRMTIDETVQRRIETRRCENCEDREGQAPPGCEGGAP